MALLQYQLTQSIRLPIHTTQNKSIYMKTRFRNSAEQCGICLENIEIEGRLNSCSHLFCLKCIKKWSEVISTQSENSCPICKARFSTIKKIPRRKEYKPSKIDLYSVDNKDQDRIINHSEFIMLLQEASSSLTIELQSLLDLILMK